MNINVTCNHQLSPQLTTQWRFNLNGVWPLRRRELDEDHGQNADMIRVVCIAWAYVQAMFCGTCTSIYVSVAACERQKWGNISMFGSCIARISWCFFMFSLLMRGSWWWGEFRAEYFYVMFIDPSGVFWAMMIGEHSRNPSFPGDVARSPPKSCVFDTNLLNYVCWYTCLSVF